MRPPFSAGSTVFALGIGLLTGCGGDSGSGDPGQQFARHDGQRPVALIQASDGNFYGVTTNGGDFGLGTVFASRPEARNWFFIRLLADQTMAVLLKA
jgi:uncharacterized repeat protein (TIGR03803 family)